MTLNWGIRLRNLCFFIMWLSRQIGCRHFHCVKRSNVAMENLIFFGWKICLCVRFMVGLVWQSCNRTVISVISHASFEHLYFLKVVLTSSFFGRLLSTVDSNLASHPAALGLILGFPKKFQKKFDVAGIYRQETVRVDSAKLNSWLNQSSTSQWHWYYKNKNKPKNNIIICHSFFSLTRLNPGNAHLNSEWGSISMVDLLVLTG